MPSASPTPSWMAPRNGSKNPRTKKGESLGRATTAIASEVAIDVLTEGIGSVATLRKVGKVADAADHVRDVPPIRLVEKDGQLFTLDNRRLEAFRRAGVAVPYRMATTEEAAAEAWKFTTQNGGTTMRVRGK
jgi:hypothetical protein